jgi:hypothetical protein
MGMGISPLKRRWGRVENGHEGDDFNVLRR